MPNSPQSASGSAVTFLHTADWQLGMHRHFLGTEAQARFGQARIDAIERIAATAGEVGAAFVVVAGDVFDANQVDRQVVLRACEALKAMPCPVYLLPGNHDSLEPGSVWSVPPLQSLLPSQVEILTDDLPRRPVEGVEVVGLPWTSRRQTGDPLAKAGAWTPPDPGVLRVGVGHGQIDALVPDAGAACTGGEPGLIGLDAVERAIAEGRVHFVALGDRHSATSAGSTGRVWYSGTTEPTRPEETDPGKILRVDLAPGQCVVTPLQVGTWSLRTKVCDVDSDEALDVLADWLAEQPDKARTVVRLGVRGSLSLAGFSRLEMLLEAQEELYAAIQRWRRHWDVALRPDEADLDRLDVGGTARGALEELRAATGEGDSEAADALALMHRLAAGA